MLMSQSSLCAALPFISYSLPITYCSCLLVQGSTLVLSCRKGDTWLKYCYALGCTVAMPCATMLLCPGMLHCCSCLYCCTVAMLWATLLLCPGRHCCYVLGYCTGAVPGLHCSGSSPGCHLSHLCCVIRAPAILKFQCVPVHQVQQVQNLTIVYDLMIGKQVLCGSPVSLHNYDIP